MIKLTSYGKDVVIKIFLLVIVLTLTGLFINNTIVKFILICLSVFLWLFTLYFFRDPDRSLPADYRKNQLVSPADGKVVLIEDVPNEGIEFFDSGNPLVQISIFLSPLNVHVNRIPVSGEVTFLKYIEGDYIVAFDNKSSSRNERTEIGITETSTGKKILFKQIAGFVARRIVYDLQTGNKVNAGEKFGMIKFGSRVDIIIEKNSKILISLDQRVTGGETIIAEL